MSFWKVHAGSFCVSVIHQTPTWTTGSLMCTRDHSYACVYTQGGWVHRQRVSTTFFTLKKLSQIFVCAHDTNAKTNMTFAVDWALKTNLSIYEYKRLKYEQQVSGNSLTHTTKEATYKCSVYSLFFPILLYVDIIKQCYMCCLP